MKSLYKKLGTTKTQSADVPENLWRNEVFHDCGDNKDRHALITIMHPEIILY